MKNSTEKDSIHLVIADDHVLFIDGLKLLLKDESHIVIDDVANDGKELLHLLEYQQPDLILLDINMPKLNGLEATGFIKRSYPKIKIVILSTYNDNHIIEKAKQHGANGYLLKNCNKEDLLQTINLVDSGQSSFPYRTPKNDNVFNSNDDFLKQFGLTKREAEIIQLIKGDLSNQDIADKLYLSIYTIETHRKNIMQKLGLKSPAALMKFIIENGL